MANTIQQKFGTAAPASDALAKGELAIRFVAADHTASSSSKLYFGEGDSANLRQFGFGIAGDSGQHGIAIGENFTITGGNALTTAVSGDAVTINHDDTSSQSSVNNSGQNFIQDITLDTYGHVTGITSATASGSSYDGDIADLDIDGATDIGAAIVDADLFIIDDGANGTNRKTTATRLKDYMYLTLRADLAIAETDPVTFASVNIGADSDGSDRQIVFGHSTLKSTIGIDDSADVFAINTDANFEVGNDLEIDASGNVAINHGNLVVPNGEVQTPNIGFSDGTNAMVINSSGEVTFPQPATFSGTITGTRLDIDTNMVLNGTKIAMNSGTLELDSAADIKLDAGGGDIFFIDDGTTFGSATNNSGNLILKSGTTTAATFSGADVTFAGDVSAGSNSLTATGSSNSFGATSFNDANITNVGSIALDTITNDGTDITLDSSNDIVIDAAGGNIEFKDAGTAQLTIDMDGTGGDIDVNLMVDGDDLVFNQYDGTEVFRIKDNATMTGTSLSLSGSLTTSTINGPGSGAGITFDTSGSYGFLFTPANNELIIGDSAGNDGWAFTEMNGNIQYINSKSNNGSSGYGFRDNNGTMQVKNSGGDWANFASSGGEANQNAFNTVSVSGQSDVVADSATDTLNLAAGSNITITTTAGTDTVTIASSGGTSVSGTDNRLVRMNGGSGLQDSGITIDDSDNISGVGTFSCGLLDNGTSDMRTGGKLFVDTDADADDNTADSATGRLAIGAGNDLNLYHGGTNSYIVNKTGNLYIHSETDNSDIVFTGEDGSSGITALTLDMSDAGAATFNSKITAVGTSVFTNLDISGDVDIDGTLETDALTIGGTTSVAFTSSDHSKLDGIASGATANAGTVTSVGLNPGTGLDAGSAITSSGTISISLDLSELADGTADIDSNDEVIYLDNGTEKRKAFSELKLSQFNNDASFVTDANVTHRTITAGGNTLANGEALDFVAGSGISISESGGDVTIAASGGGGSTSPSGSGSVSGNNAEIQFNDDGSFASDGSLVWDGTKLIIEVATDDTAALKLKCTEDTAEDGPRLDLERSAGGSSQAGDGDEIGRIRFNADKTNGSLITYAALEGGIVDNSDSTADGIMRVGIRRQGGYEADFFNIGCSSTGGNRAIFAGTTNEVDIGTSSKTFKTAYSRTYVGHDGAQNQTGTTDGMNFVTGNSIDVTVSSAGGIVFEMRALNLSDENLKDNISQYNTGLSMINQLTPKSFTIKDKVGTSIKDRTGFIAQDVEKISSDYVEESNYTEGDTKFLALSQNFNDELIAAQINAIKELSAKNDALEARIAALEAK